MKKIFCIFAVLFTLMLCFLIIPQSGESECECFSDSSREFIPLKMDSSATHFNDFCSFNEDPLFLSAPLCSLFMHKFSELIPVRLDVEPIAQHPVLPNGCEAVSMTMLLRYAGVEADPVDFALNYLPREEITRSGNLLIVPDPEEKYIGDPCSETNGWYCFEEPVIIGANRLLSDYNAPFSARALDSASYFDLWCCLYTGHPVAVWLTVDYEMPRLCRNIRFRLSDHTTINPFQNLHCVVLTGMDEDQFYLCDPAHGELSISRERFFSLFNAMGNRAVILESSSSC